MCTGTYRSKHFLNNLIPSHGVNRLEMYISEIQEGEVDHKVQPEIVSETESIACVDGHNGLGNHSFSRLKRQQFL